MPLLTGVINKLTISCDEILDGLDEYMNKYIDIRCPACRFYACVDCAEMNHICNSVDYGECVHYGNNH